MESLRLEEAIEQIVKTCSPISQTESLTICQCQGRILAGDIRSSFPVPPFDRSPLDGYALRAADTAGASKAHPVSLKVLETVMAGDVPAQTVYPGTCTKIMTGAMLPVGADCVIRQEDTDYGEDTVCICQPLSPWQNYCYAGEDVEKDSLVIPSGEKLTFLHQAVLASLGLTHVSVLRKPRVAVITTGSEVVAPGEPLPAGKIYNSNFTLLTCRLVSLGFPVVYASHAEDTLEACCLCIQEAAAMGAELIVTTGGVSVGQRDVMHDVLEQLPAKRIFWRVRLKPGSPVLFGAYHSVPLLCLSGNPFAAYATFELLARPALAVLSSDPSLNLRPCKAVLAGGFEKSSPCRRFLRGFYKDGTVTLPGTAKHASGILGSALNCNCLVDIPQGSEKLKDGDAVSILLTD